MDIQWYPGHMAKAKRQLSEKLKLINVAVVVADARAPRSTMNPDLYAMLEGKPCVAVLNKRDLADEALTAKWVAHYEKQYGAALAFSATQDKPGALIAAIAKAAAPVVRKYADKGMNKTVRVLIAGIPNTGKSAIINRLLGRKSAKEGDKPGVTRGLQWVKLSGNLELLDSPGLLWPKIESQGTAAKIALCGSLKQENVDITELALHLIRLINGIAPEALMSRYGVTYAGDAIETLSEVCRKRGFLLRGAEPDIERSAKVLLDEFKGGKLGRITLERPQDD
jgi:ribosome biogenesis GTPase A